MFISDVPYFAERVDQYLTLYYSQAQSERIVGMQLTGMTRTKDYLQKLRIPDESPEYEFKLNLLRLLSKAEDDPNLLEKLEQVIAGLDRVLLSNN